MGLRCIMLMALLILLLSILLLDFVGETDVMTNLGTLTGMMLMVSTM